MIILPNSTTTDDCWRYPARVPGARHMHWMTGATQPDLSDVLAACRGSRRTTPPAKTARMQPHAPTARQRIRVQGHRRAERRGPRDSSLASCQRNQDDDTPTCQTQTGSGLGFQEGHTARGARIESMAQRRGCCMAEWTVRYKSRAAQRSGACATTILFFSSAQTIKTRKTQSVEQQWAKWDTTSTSASSRTCSAP